MAYFFSHIRPIFLVYSAHVDWTKKNSCGMKTLADLGDIAMLTRQVNFLFVSIKTFIREHI